MNYIKKKNEEEIILLLSFIIVPTISFLITIVKIFRSDKLKKIDCLIVSLYMAFLGFLVAPLGDLYRHNAKFELLKKMNFSEIRLELKGSVDYFLTIISTIFSKVGLPFQLIPFLAILFCYYSSFLILKEFINYKHKNIKNLYFFMLFFSINFFVISVGIRSGLAAHVFIYSIYLYYIKNRRVKSIILMSVSLSIHFYILPLIFLFLIAKRIKQGNIEKFLILSLVFIFFGKEIVEILINYVPMPQIIENRIKSYIYGYWAKDYLNEKSIKYMIYLVLSKISYVPIMFYCIFFKNTNTIRKILLILLILSNLFFNFIAIFERYCYISIILGILIMAFEENKIRKARKLKIIVVYFSVVTFISNIYAFRSNTKINNQFKIIYKPAILLFYERYDKEWLDKNVTTKGDILVK